MQSVSSTVQQQSASLFSSALSYARPFLTPKRVVYMLAGALICAGAITLIHAQAVSHGANGQNTPSITTRTTNSSHTSSNPAGAHSSTQTTFTSNTAADGTTTTHLNVNGRDIAVPTNGSTSQTITDQSGTTTKVETSGNTSSDVSHSNSSINVNVHSSSSDSSGGGG